MIDRFAKRNNRAERLRNNRAERLRIIIPSPLRDVKSGDVEAGNVKKQLHTESVYTLVFWRLGM